MGILSVIFSIFLFYVGWSTKNKYAVLASERTILIFFSLEIFLNFLIIFFLFYFESFSFFQVVSLQDVFCAGFFLNMPIMPVLCIIFF